MKVGLMEMLQNDPSVSKDTFTPSFTEEDFAGFVLDYMLILLVQGQQDCNVLLEMIRRVIYK